MKRRQPSEAACRFLVLIRWALPRTPAGAQRGRERPARRTFAGRAFGRAKAPPF